MRVCAFSGVISKSKNILVIKGSISDMKLKEAEVSISTLEFLYVLEHIFTLSMNNLQIYRGSFIKKKKPTSFIKVYE